MSAKRPTKEGPEQSGPDPKEIERLKNLVPIPEPTFLVDDELSFALWYMRYLTRVEKWVRANTPETIAQKLTMVMVERRRYDREMMSMCEALATDRAELKYQRTYARKGKESSVWKPIKAQWESWQANPGRYETAKDFAAAMEAKYPGATAGTLSNKVTQWKREAESQNGDS